MGKTRLIKRIEGKEFNDKEKHASNTDETMIDYKNNKIKIYDIDNGKKDIKDISKIISDYKICFLVYNIKKRNS